MNLQGQASGSPSRRRPPHDGGYAMAALLTMLAVMSILMSAALPVWRQQMRREKEAELVFRGEQYARAVGLFNQKFRTFPPNIDVLVQQKFLRKKYKDPITGKDFRPVYVGGIGSPQSQPGQPSGDQPGQQQGASRPAPAPIGAAPAPIGTPAGPRQGSAPTGGVMGVTSESDETSIRVYNGRTKYNQWQFVYAQAAGRPGGPAGRPTPGGGPMRPSPGQPGRPGQPVGQPQRMGPGGTPFPRMNPPPRPPSGQRPPGGDD